MLLNQKSNNRFNSPENFFGPLLRIGWLADQTREFQDWAARVGVAQHVSAGQFVYHAGETPDGVYGLRSGVIEVEFPLLADEPASLLRTNEGFWIGDSGLLSDQPRLVSLLAVEDSTFVVLPAQEIEHLLNNDPKHWRAFYDLSHRNVGIAVELLAEALSLSVRARVCRRLLYLSEKRLEAPTTQDSLAKTLGVARPTLRRSLNSLAELGAIELKYRRVAIVDRTILQEFKNEQ